MYLLLYLVLYPDSGYSDRCGLIQRAKTIVLLWHTKTTVCGCIKIKIDTFVLMDFGEAFGRVLKAHRTGAGLSQEELAHRAGMHSTTISLYERGERRPSLQTIFIIAGSLNLRPEELVAEVGKLNPKLD